MTGAFCFCVLFPFVPRSFPHSMEAGGENAQAVFRKDVERTYADLVDRVEIAKQEEAVSGDEWPIQPWIQLIDDDPDTAILFNVPNGPPPEYQMLEGRGTESMDVEEECEAMQMRWDIYSGLPENLQEALKTHDLAAVNKALEYMPFSVAENAVEALTTGGILSYYKRRNRASCSSGR